MVLALGISLPLRLKRSGGFESSVFALLPRSEQDPRAASAVKQIAQATSQKLIILCGAGDLGEAGKAADAAVEVLREAGSLISATAKVNSGALEKGLAFYKAHRFGLLTPDERQDLAAGDSRLYQQTLSSLYTPLGVPRLFSLEEDPMGLASRYLLSQAGQQSLMMQEGRLTLQADGISYVAVLAQLNADADSFAVQQRMQVILSKASQAAKTAGAKDILRAGFIFHASEASSGASREVSTIGVGSLVGVILLMLWVFRGPKPMFLVLLPVAVATLVGLAVCALVFDKVHLLTLVFGSSIIGVAQDYGVLFVCGALQERPWDPWRHLAMIRRGLFLAMLTTVLGYAVLGAVPFPGLQQMGVYSIAGIFAGWLSSILWLPWLAKTMPVPRAEGLRWLQAAERHWPRIEAPWFRWSLLGLTLLSLVGLTRVKAQDDVRKLYDSSRRLSQEEERLRTLLKFPGGGQFFLIQAGSADEMLQHEEALVERLGAAKEKGLILSWQALSNFVPSATRQAENQRLQEDKVFGPQGLARQLFKELGEEGGAARARRSAHAAGETLTLAAWQAEPLSQPYRHLLLPGPGWASVVLLAGLGPAGMPAMRQAAQGLPGVSFVDYVGGINAMLQRFRISISWLLIVGYALAGFALFFFYGGAWWRVVAPSALAALLAVGLPALAGQPYSIFHALGLVLGLGMGVDYGIFMAEPREKGSGSAFLPVCLAAIATLLCFGLLALSHTPALSNFGLSVLLGIGLAWLLTPCFTPLHKGTDHAQ